MATAPHYGSDQPLTVATVPPRIPVLDAGDLPGDDDWAVIEALGVDHDAAIDHDTQYDRYGSLMLAPGAFD